MTHPRLLFNLQQIDSQLFQSHDRLAEIDAILNDNAALKKARMKASKTDDAHKKAILALKHAEQDVQSQNEKIERNQKTLYSGTVKNPKELEDLQHECEALKRYLAVLEDRQLEVMIALESAAEAHTQATRQLETLQKEIAQQNVDLTGEQQTLQASVSELETQRADLAGSIDPAVLKTYNQLLESRGGLAVVEIKGNICNACGATLTAAQAQAARSPTKVTQCASCSRIIVAK